MKSSPIHKIQIKLSSHSPHQTHLIKDSFGKVGSFNCIKMPKDPLNYFTYAYSMLYSVKVDNKPYFCKYYIICITSPPSKR